MQIFKQMVLKNYQKFIEHNLNNRFFPYHLGQAVSLALVILEEDKGVKLLEDDEVEEFNRLYYNYLIQPLEQTKHILDLELRQIQYNKIKEEIEYVFQRKIKDLINVIYYYLKTYKDVDVKKQEYKDKFYSKGVLAVINPYWSYETIELS